MANTINQCVITLFWVISAYGKSALLVLTSPVYRGIYSRIGIQTLLVSLGNHMNMKFNKSFDILEDGSVIGLGLIEKTEILHKRYYYRT
ncbi:MAG: hypothetical protein WB474_03820 [Nitrososphaeraceae archaeon]